MKKKELFLIGGLIVFGLIFQYFDSENISFIKGCSTDSRTLLDKEHPHEFKENFTLNPSINELVFDNPAGSVEISPSSDGPVSVESIMVVYHKNVSKVEKYREKVKLRNDSEGDRSFVGTISDSDDFPYQRVRTHFRIKMPVNTKLSIRNKFGTIKVDQAGREVEIDGTFGDLYISGIQSDISVKNRFGRTEINEINGKIELDIKFSEAEVTGANSIDCRAGHSRLNISNIRDSRSIKIEGTHTKLNLDEIDTDQIRIKDSHNRITLNKVLTKELLLTARHCRIDIEELRSDSISIKNSHNTIRLKNIEGGNLNVLLSNGDLSLSLKSMFDMIFVTNSYSDISLTIPSGTNPSISLNTKYGNIKNMTDLDLSAVKAKYLTTFSREGEKSQININTSYGDIDLRSPSK